MMRNKFPIKATHRELSIIAGSFAGNGASSPLATTRQGVGFTVSRVSAGLYRITLGSQPSVPAGLLPATDKMQTLVSGVATIESTAATVDRVVTLKANSPTTGVFDFEVKTAAVLTDLASTDRLNFILVLTDSLTKPVRG